MINLKALATQASLIIALAITITSCTNSGKVTDTRSVVQKTNDDKFEGTNMSEDADFLVKAAEMNLEQIQLGQLAQRNGTSAHVREFGAMIERAHTASLNELTALARRKMITIPSTIKESAQEEYVKLGAKTGEEFDKEFNEIMVSKHRDGQETFEKATSDCKDEEIRTWARAQTQVWAEHFEMAKDCKRKCDEMKH